MKVVINSIIIIAIFFISCSLFDGNNGDVKPPFTDYCEMIARDIAGKKHGVLAGNLMNYVGGQSNANYDIVEHETISLSICVVYMRFHR